jgi:hypothetical protein
VPSRRSTVALAAAALAAAAPAPGAAWGWESYEHQEIGRTSYAQACEQIAAEVAVRAAADARLAARLERACGRNAAVAARLYGDATAIAGDHLSDPHEFLSHLGAWRFNSRKSYWLLALENSEHFNPKSTRSWRAYHGQAVDYALRAARADGLEMIESFELAFYENAFADHFLQDSFASGHMGFNRPATSAGAAKRFHDYWNARGRVVGDRAGRRWFGYGDGRLDAAGNAGNRAQVVYAATQSVRHLLRSFVLGEASSDEALAVWDALPYTIDAPELKVDAVQIFAAETAAHGLDPLAGAIRPARKDTVGAARFWSAAPFDDAGHPILAVVAGFDLAVPFIPLQAHLGAGGALREPDGGRGAIIETGVLVPLFLSIDGLISHQIGVTASWILRPRLITVLHAEYQMNIELGAALVSAHVGLAELFPGTQTGWYGALGLGFVFSAAGGGAL